jgi:hypothetical protein
MRFAGALVAASLTVRTRFGMARRCQQKLSQSRIEADSKALSSRETGRGESRTLTFACRSQAESVLGRLRAWRFARHADSFFPCPGSTNPAPA